MKPIEIIDTKELILKDEFGNPVLDVEGNNVLDTEAWLKIKQGYIGGSDTAAILGVSPWTSRKKLYDTKLGIAPKAETSIAMEIGHYAEPYVRYKVVPHILREVCGYSAEEFEVKEDSVMYQHGDPRYYFANADVDGRIRIGEEWGILECKTTGAYNTEIIQKWKDGIVPEYYLCQIRHYMAVCDAPFAIICVSWGFNPLTEAVLLRVDRDLKEEEKLMEAEREFWENHVIPKNPPSDLGCNPKAALSYLAVREVTDATITDEEAVIKATLNLSKKKEELAVKNKEVKTLENEVKALELALMEELGEPKKVIFRDEAENYYIAESVRKTASPSYNVRAVLRDFPNLVDNCTLLKKGLDNTTLASLTPYLELPRTHEDAGLKVSVSVLTKEQYEKKLERDKKKEKAK